MNEADAPVLTGSPKQTAWARDIRSGALESADEIVEALRRMLELDDDDEMLAWRVEKAIEIFKEDLARTDASWWIDNDLLFPAGKAFEEKALASAADESETRSILEFDRKRRIDFARSHYLFEAALAFHPWCGRL